MELGDVNYLISVGTVLIFHAWRAGGFFPSQAHRHGSLMPGLDTHRFALPLRSGGVVVKTASSLAILLVANVARCIAGKLAIG